MKLWVDDLRTQPNGWAWAKSFWEAIAYLSEGCVTEISLDHDLGDTASLMEKTGYDVALYMAEHNIWPSKVFVHSANPVGASDIVKLVQRHHPMWPDLQWVIWEG